MLYRSARRRTSTEVGPDEFCETEFPAKRSGGLDLRLSVYDVDAGQWIACHAEHLAGAKLNPPGNPPLDLAGLMVPVPRPRGEEWPFAMTRRAHCEASFSADGEVREMAHALFNDLGRRRQEVTRDDIRRHILAAVERGDPEWAAFLGSAAKAWRKLAEGAEARPASRAAPVQHPERWPVSSETVGAILRLLMLAAGVAAVTGIARRLVPTAWDVPVSIAAAVAIVVGALVLFRGVGR